MIDNLEPPGPTWTHAPWVGAAYESAGFDGLKVLLLGESQYDTREGTALNRQPPKLERTRRLVEKWAIGRRKHRFYTTSAKLVEGPGGEGGAAFWRRVAFYNYIQEVVGSRPRQRPTNEMWDSAQAPFLDVLEQLRPDCVVVLGKALWRALRVAPVGRVRLERHPNAWVLPDGMRIPVAHTAHPSSFGFQYPRWRPGVEALLVRARVGRPHASALQPPETLTNGPRL
jgi:hypothetical protein